MLVHEAVYFDRGASGGVFERQSVQSLPTPCFLSALREAYFPFSADEVAAMHRRGVDDPAALVANHQEVYFASAELSDEAREAQLSIGY